MYILSLSYRGEVCGIKHRLFYTSVLFFSFVHGTYFLFVFVQSAYLFVIWLLQHQRYKDLCTSFFMVNLVPNRCLTYQISNRLCLWSQTVLSFNDSLEVLPEFRNVVYGTVYYSKRIRLISTKEKGACSRVQERLSTSFSFSSPSEVIQTALNFFQQ